MSNAETTETRLLDKFAVAERLGVKVRFVERLVEERRIDYLKIGRQFRFDSETIEAWIVQRRVPERSRLSG